MFTSSVFSLKNIITNVHFKDSYDYHVFTFIVIITLDTYILFNGVLLHMSAAQYAPTNMQPQNTNHQRSPRINRYTL